MDRRGFLRTAALGALSSAATVGGQGAPDWAALGRVLDGRLVRPGDAGYDTARRLYNPTFDTVRPRGVAYCATPSDVAECLAFARKERVPLTSRSGGHSYAGWSTGPGLVIDVSRMNTVTYRSGLATVGAGAKLIDVYDRLNARGVSIPAGTCPTVGIAGLTLGGGIGVVSRKHGLTCDVLESVRVVTADGRVLTCDENTHSDLFWACRGGGGGNFGVAVSFTFRTHPISDVAVFFLHWPWSRAAAVVKAWQSWAPAAPDAMWSNLHLTRSAGGLDVQVGGLYLGGTAGCAKLLDGLLKATGAPSSRYVVERSHLAATMIMAGCAGRTVAQCRRMPREAFVASSHLAYAKLPTAGARELVARVARPGGHAVLIDAMGGAIGRVRPDATAFPHRQALFSVQYYADGSDRAWLRGTRRAMGPHLGEHAYVNYLDPDITQWRQAYYGANAGRLAAVKAAYDPGRLFALPQGV
ncbi:FAD-binding oxidoreductase [Nonomuraea sp. NPDC059194]|uniref:FAD-binding oxidoreductase n=1 Tax=Nonomuraea sp. NPDC059194 TaxID=3346764 RepID=UPI0036A53778